MKKIIVAVMLAAVSLSLRADDLNPYFPTNQGKASAVPNGEVVFSPCLSISPARKTVLPSQSLYFTAYGATNPVTWFTIDNLSGSVLTPIGTNVAHYVAGSTSSCIDVIEAWDGNYRFGRAYINVISELEVAQAGKAIIVAGRKSPSDPLWPATDYLADLGYNTLMYRGFSTGNVEYLSPVVNQDVDGDGENNDIDLESTAANAAFAFTNWASNMDKLFVYLVDHGSDAADGSFYLNGTETLTSTQLDGWLDSMQDRWTNDVVVVLDFCNAGSFLDDLTYTGAAKRVVIASCADTNLSYFVAGGLVSFSDAFFSGVMMGLNVRDCFEQARTAMNVYQQSWMDDDSNGVFSAGIDGAVCVNQFIGASFVAGKDIPQIGLVCGNQLLSGSTRATLWADYVVSAYPIERVWCLIVPPGHNPPAGNPVSDLPELTLVFNPSSGRYEAQYEGFSDQGVYKVIYYAVDQWGSVSLPQQSYVTQEGYDERLIIVVGGETNTARWPTLDNLGKMTYHVARQRWFTSSNIWYMTSDPSQDIDGDGTNDVDEAPSLEGLSYAITNWAWGSDKLTVYIVGEGGDGTVTMNASESLGVEDLDYWLDLAQQSNADACVVMEFSGASAFMPGLKPPDGANRVTIAGTTKLSNYGNYGKMSFTTFFLSMVFSGFDINTSFGWAKKAIDAIASFSPQVGVPQLDDNGDGVWNKNDGKIARNWHLGTAFMTGADTPEIGSVTPDTWLFGTNSLLLWAADVTDMDGISNVWVLVTPPNYDGESDVPETNLVWNAVSNRYEVLFDGFTAAGTYVCTFYASDTNGEVSVAVQCNIRTGDEYEPDDTMEIAGMYNVGIDQIHNFHASNDEDWVWFWASSNYSYSIEPFQIGTNVDAAVDVYRLLLDGSLETVVTKDEWAMGTDVWETVNLTFPTEGFYYVRVRNADSTGAGWGFESDYRLSINIPAGLAGCVFVMGMNGLTDGFLPAGVRAHLSSGEDGWLDSATSVSFAKNAGTYTVTLVGVPAGWKYMNCQSSKTVTLSDGGYASACFVLMPYVKVTGKIKDSLTGDSVVGASLQGLGLSGRMTGQTGQISGLTQSDGSLPAGVELVAENWNLQVSKDWFSNLLVPVNGCGATPGSTIDIGTCSMSLSDGNLNQMADIWETTYFGGAAVPTEDADGDGQNNLEEFIVGTHPKNSNSVFKVQEFQKTGSGMKLSWPASSGRSYRVRRRASITTGDWSVVWGPWTAPVGTTNVTWTDPDTSGSSRYYHIQVLH